MAAVVKVFIFFPEVFQSCVNKRFLWEKYLEEVRELIG